MHLWGICFVQGRKIKNFYLLDFYLFLLFKEPSASSRTIRQVLSCFVGANIKECPIPIVPTGSVEAGMTVYHSSRTKGVVEEEDAEDEKTTADKKGHKKGKANRSSKSRVEEDEEEDEEEEKTKACKK
jgi:hypothetical protein